MDNVISVFWRELKQAYCFDARLNFVNLTQKIAVFNNPDYFL